MTAPDLSLIERMMRARGTGKCWSCEAPIAGADDAVLDKRAGFYRADADDPAVGEPCRGGIEWIHRRCLTREAQAAWSRRWSGGHG